MSILHRRLRYFTSCSHTAQTKQTRARPPRGHFAPSNSRNKGAQSARCLAHTAFRTLSRTSGAVVFLPAGKAAEAWSYPPPQSSANWLGKFRFSANNEKEGRGRGLNWGCILNCGIETATDVIQSRERTGGSWTQLAVVSTWSSGSGKLHVNCARRSLLKGAFTIIPFLQKTRWAHRIVTRLYVCLSVGAVCKSLTSWHHICALEGMTVVTIKWAGITKKRECKNHRRKM
jgi:hypothetical protein